MRQSEMFQAADASGWRQVFWIPYLKKGNRAFLVVCELLQEFHPEAGARESAVGPAPARQPENSLKIISGS